MHIGGACIPNQTVDGIEIELTFAWLKELPIDWSQHRVQVHGFELAPIRTQVFEIRCARVAKLAAAYQNWFAVDYQLSCMPSLPQLRQRRLCMDVGGDQDRRTEQSESMSHRKLHG
jgi:hypothetical protein